jgi:hypothetical protein
VSGSGQGDGDGLNRGEETRGRGHGRDGKGGLLLDAGAKGALEVGVEGLEAGQGRGAGSARAQDRGHDGDGLPGGEGRHGGEGQGRDGQVAGQGVEHRGQVAGQGLENRGQVAGQRGEDRGQDRGDVARQGRENVRDGRFNGAKVARERRDEGDGGERLGDSGQREGGEGEEGRVHEGAGGLGLGSRVPGAVRGVALAVIVLLAALVVVVVVTVRAAAVAAAVPTGVVAGVALAARAAKVGPVGSVAVVGESSAKEVGATTDFLLVLTTFTSLHQWNGGDERINDLQIISKYPLSPGNCHPEVTYRCDEVAEHGYGSCLGGDAIGNGGHCHCRRWDWKAGGTEFQSRFKVGQSRDEVECIQLAEALSWKHECLHCGERQNICEKDGTSGRHFRSWLVSIELCKCYEMIVSVVE